LAHRNLWGEIRYPHRAGGAGVGDDIASAPHRTLSTRAGRRRRRTRRHAFLEFFAANIRNPHTRRAYARAADEFLAWCASAGVPAIGAVQPVHVATWIEAATRELAAPSVKQRLAAICRRDEVSLDEVERIVI
jgi:hypothetical protein